MKRAHAPRLAFVDLHRVGQLHDLLASRCDHDAREVGGLSKSRLRKMQRRAEFLLARALKIAGWR